MMLAYLMSVFTQYVELSETQKTVSQTLTREAGQTSMREDWQVCALSPTLAWSDAQQCASWALTAHKKSATRVPSPLPPDCLRAPTQRENFPKDFKSMLSALERFGVDVEQFTYDYDMCPGIPKPPGQQTGGKPCGLLYR